MKKIYAGKEREVYELHVDEGLTFKEIADRFGGTAAGAREAYKRYEGGVLQHAPVITALNEPTITERERKLIRSIKDTNAKRAQFGKILEEIGNYYMQKFRDDPDSLTKDERNAIFRAIGEGNKLLQSIDATLKVNYQFINRGNINVGATPENKEERRREIFRARREGLMLSEKFIRKIDAWDAYMEFLDDESERPPGPPKKNGEVGMDAAEVIDVEFH